MVAETCRWCRLLGTAPNLVYADAAFLLLGSSIGDRRDQFVTLVATAHVARITDMAPEDMVSFLAGLSKLISWLKETRGVEDVKIRIHPRSYGRQRANQHLHLRLSLR